ncbi:MAG: isochorismate synthase [Acidimicrobiales bacterium]
MSPATTSTRLVAPGATKVQMAATVDPWRLFADAPGDRAVLWREPGTATVTVGIGAAAEITSHSPAVRFAEVAAGLSSTTGADSGSDRWFGGFSFDCGETPDDLWADHPCGALTLPVFTFDIDPTATTTCIVRGGDADAAHHLVAAIDPPMARRGTGAARAVEEDREAYTNLVTTALGEISAHRLEKVVLARRRTHHGPVDVAEVLAGLAARQPSCAIFAFRRGPRVFLGASPELLLAHDGAGHVTSAAVAGSRSRGRDDADDTLMAAELAADPKEVAEHAYVVDDLRRQLAAAGVRLDPPAVAEIRRLPGIQHLYTPVSGSLDPDSRHVIEILGALHPSPAVCGTPTAAARRFIRDHEGLDRGWYAGPVGWIDGRGAASFHVGLRSGVIDPGVGVTHLFAGAGIVAGSQPGSELTETDVKLDALGTALGS